MTYIEHWFNFINFSEAQLEIYLAIYIFWLKSFQPETVWFFDSLCDTVGIFIEVFAWLFKETGGNC